MTNVLMIFELFLLHVLPELIVSARNVHPVYSCAPWMHLQEEDDPAKTRVETASCNAAET